MRSIKLITSTVADAILAGSGFYAAQVAEQRQAELEAARQQIAEGGGESGGEAGAGAGRARMVGRKQGPGGRRTIKDRISRPRTTDRAVLAEVEAEVAPEPVESTIVVAEEAAAALTEERAAVSGDSDESAGR
jgi:hypothetical protein